MKTIALFVCDPKCSVQSSNGIISALGEFYKFKLFSKNEVEDNFFNDVDLIAVPGGFGDSDSFDTLLNSTYMPCCIRPNAIFLSINFVNFGNT